jgi:Zn-dependent membrane protease YugP
MIGFDPLYFLFVAPAFLLAMWAQMRIRSTYATAQQMPAALSGAAAAQYILNSAGVGHVQVEPVPGHLSDHYDPRHKVLRLSEEVFNSRTLAAVGIAAHEAGHAIQDARNYAPLVIRNAAVPAASIGPALLWLGIGAFGCVVAFQVINLPVEFDASARAKQQLVTLGIVDHEGLQYVNKVLNAAALTYVAATLQSILTLLYYILRFTGGSRDE